MIYTYSGIVMALNVPTTFDIVKNRKYTYISKYVKKRFNSAKPLCTQIEGFVKVFQNLYELNYMILYSPEYTNAKREFCV